MSNEPAQPSASVVIESLRQQGLLDLFLSLYRKARIRGWVFYAPETLSEKHDFDEFLAMGLVRLDPKFTSLHIVESNRRLIKNEIFADVTPHGATVGEAALA